MRASEHIAAEVPAENAGAVRSDPPADQEPAEELLVEEELVEDVSIDGMCGVY